MESKICMCGDEPCTDANFARCYCSWGGPVTCGCEREGCVIKDQEFAMHWRCMHWSVMCALPVMIRLVKEIEEYDELR